MSNVVQMRRRFQQQPLAPAESVEDGELVEQLQRKSCDLLDMGRTDFLFAHEGQRFLAGVRFVHKAKAWSMKSRSDDRQRLHPGLRRENDFTLKHQPGEVRLPRS